MKRPLIALGAVLGLALTEALLQRELADRGLVAALLAAGAHSSIWAIGCAVGFLALRLFLLIGLPALLGAMAARHAISHVISVIYARTAARRAQRALSSASPVGSGGRHNEQTR